MFSSALALRPFVVPRRHLPASPPPLHNSVLALVVAVKQLLHSVWVPLLLLPLVVPPLLLVAHPLGHSGFGCEASFLFVFGKIIPSFNGKAILGDNKIK
jgi:hypothetical protein